MTTNETPREHFAGGINRGVHKSSDGLADVAGVFAREGYALVPVRGKVPISQAWQDPYPPTGPNVAEWVNAGADGFGLVADLPPDAAHYAKMPASHGLVCLDVEAAGMRALADVIDRIRELCPYAVVPTPGGGVHVWCRVSDADLSRSHKLGYAPGGPSLGAEVRGRGAQAVIVGPGRIDTVAAAERFDPATMTQQEWNALLDAVRERLDPPPASRQAQAQRFATPGSSPTAEALRRAVLEGRLRWVDLLDDGWTEVDTDTDGRLHLLRPDYGSPSTQRESANALGGVLQVHSTSVPWHADIHGGYDPAGALAFSRFGGDFRAAMVAVEAAAAQPPGHRVAPFDRWPEDLLTEVAAGSRRAPVARHGGGVKADLLDMVLGPFPVFDLGRSADSRAYLVRRDGPNVALMGKAARDALSGAYFSRHGTAPGGEALREVWSVLEGTAAGLEPTDLPTRVALWQGGFVLDLGRVDGSSVVADASGWQVVDRSPLTFRRATTQRAMPVPVGGGSIDALWQVVNIAAEARELLRAYLAVAMLPEVEHPVLLLRGEQGAAKTTTTRVLAELIDPHDGNPLAPPSGAEGFGVTAASRWCVPYDNLSAIPDLFSDNLCRLVTGGSYTSRALYTDDGVISVPLRGVAIINGITLGSLRSDLADRLLTLDLHAPVRRLTTQQLNRDLSQHHPAILGAMLDDAVAILARLDATPTPDIRMAGFARAVAAHDAATGEQALAAYRAVLEDAAADAMEGDPLALAIVALMEARDGEPWEGPAEALLLALKPHHDRLIHAGRADGRYWPASGSRLSRDLPRSESVLAKVAGVQVRKLPRSKSARRWRITTTARSEG